MAKAVVPEGEEKWKAEGDMRTLVEAEAIRNDDKRLKAALKCARDQLKNLKEAMSSSSGDKE